MPMFRLPRRSRWISVAALALVAAAVGLGIRHRLDAADHRDSTALTGDPRADIADVYAFRSPANPSNVVLVLTVAGFTPPAEASRTFFDPTVLYEWKIDNNNDAVEDLVLQAFVTGEGADQTIHFRGPARPLVTGNTSRVLQTSDAARVRISTGASANIATGGGLTVFAGVRDDPFFFDGARFGEIVRGEAASFRDPGVNTFAGTNVLALVVEMPAARLGANRVGVWGTTGR
jgi:hypothetical protein